MGKPGKKRVTADLKKPTAAEKASSKYSVSQLLDKADENIDKFQYEVADKFCERALDLDGDDIRALETSGSLKVELGQMEAAVQVFAKAVCLCPDIGHSKYLCLGQLYEGHQAADSYEKGIAIMLKNHSQETTDNVNESTAKKAISNNGFFNVMTSQTKNLACSSDENMECTEPGASGDNNTSQNSDESGSTTKNTCTSYEISMAYISLAELYLTDLCCEEEADVKCKDLCNKAIAMDSDNSEAYRVLADCLMSLEETQGARENIKKSVDIWMSSVKQQMALLTKDETHTKECDPYIDQNPLRASKVPFQSRVSSAKILIELEEYDLSSEVLEILLDENDTVTEVWYLLGWSNYLQGEDYRGNARFYLSKAQQCHSVISTSDSDHLLIDHIEELLQELGPGEEEEELEDVDDDEDIDDFDSDVDSDIENIEP